MNEKDRNYKNISLRKKFINPLLKLINQTSKNNNKYNESGSNSKYRKYNTIKYDKKTHLVKKKPQNVKTIINSFNKYERNNKYRDNYYILFSFRNNEINKSKQSPKSVVNNSPFYLKRKINNMHNKKINKKNNIFNFEKLKRINNMNNLNLGKNTHNTHRTGNNSEIDNIKDSNYFININSNKFKYNKFSKKIDKGLNLLKRNTITRISPVQNSKENSYKKGKNMIKKFYLSNPFRIDSSIINNRTFNQNLLSNSITNPRRYYGNNYKGISSIISYNSYKEDIKKNRKKDVFKKSNLILIKSNMSLLGWKCLNSSINKKSREISSKNSSIMKKSKKRKIKTNIINNKINNNLNSNIKNNILKTTIDKSMSRNDLKMKINQNLILKSCFSNISNISDKKGIFVFEDLDINKKNSSKKSSILNINEKILLKNKIKKKFDLNTNKNGIKKSRICLKLPMLSGLNKI